MLIRPGVAGVVFDVRDRVLLHRRPFEDGWAPPSGAVETGEDVRSALHRELWEETRLVVEIERLVGLYSDPHYQTVCYPDGRAVQFVTSLFSCRVRAGRLRGSDEGTAWGWFASDDWPEPLLPYAERWLEDALAGYMQSVVR